MRSSYLWLSHLRKLHFVRSWQFKEIPPSPAFVDLTIIDLLDSLTTKTGKFMPKYLFQQCFAHWTTKYKKLKYLNCARTCWKRYFDIYLPVFVIIRSTKLIIDMLKKASKGRISLNFHKVILCEHFSLIQVLTLLFKTRI